MVYLALDKPFADKNLPNWNKEAIDEIGEEDGKNTYLYMDDKSMKIQKMDDEGNITVACETSKFGYFSADIELTVKDLLGLIEIAVKKLNKYKSLLESLK